MADVEVEPRDEEGRTPAAWVAITIMLVGFAIGTWAVCIQNWLLFWIGGVGVLILGCIVGKVMAMMGLGQYPKETKAAA